MAERNYKVGEPIKVVYQAPNAESGLTIEAEIFLPNDEKDSGFPDIILSEMGGSGVYKETFTPDVQGEWKAVIHKDDGDGQVVKRYSVGAYDVHSVGEGVAALPDAAAVNAEVDQALVDYDAPTKAELDAAHSTTDGKIDALDTKVSSLDTPPMVS